MIDSNTPVAMEAAILLKVDDANTRREINQAAGTVSQQLGRVEQRAGKQVGRALSQTVSEVAGKMKEAADKLYAVLDVPLKFGLAAGGGAVAAFLRSNTAEATIFKIRLSEVQTALGGIGQKLSMETRVLGRTGFEWAEKLVDALNNISTDQLEKVAGILKNIAATMVGLKGFSLGADLVKSLAAMVYLAKSAPAAGGAAAVGGKAAAVASVGLAIGFEGGNLVRMAQGKDRIGYGEAWRAVQQEGLRYGTGTAMENGQFNIRGAALTNAQREAARNAVTTQRDRRLFGAEGRLGFFTRNMQADLINRNTTREAVNKWAREDAQRSGYAAPVTYSEVKGRIPDLNNLMKSASEAEEMFSNMINVSGAKLGTALFDTLDALRQEAIARGTTLAQARAAIHRLKETEEEQRAALREERVAVLDDFLAADAQRVASREGPREEFARSAAELTRQRDEQIAARDRTSLALGMAASQMPAFTATRLNEASNVNKDLEREQAEYLRELAEIERMKKQTEETWRSEDVEARRLMEERVRKIEEAVTGVGVGTPAP